MESKYRQAEGSSSEPEVFPYFLLYLPGARKPLREDDIVASRERCAQACSFQARRRKKTKKKAEKPTA
jgi:hypothetical protein